MKEKQKRPVFCCAFVGVFESEASFEVLERVPAGRGGIPAPTWGSLIHRSIFSSEKGMFQRDYI